MPLSQWEWKREMTFASDLKFSHSIIDSILEAIQALGWDGRDLFAIQMSLEEAFANAIMHGNKYNAQKNVHFSEMLSRDIIRFRVVDEGDGFNANAVPDPTAIENIEVASGRGVHLIRGFMTTVEYNEKGTVLQMEKVRSA